MTDFFYQRTEIDKFHTKIKCVREKLVMRVREPVYVRKPPLHSMSYALMESNDYLSFKTSKLLSSFSLSAPMSSSSKLIGNVNACPLYLMSAWNCTFCLSRGIPCCSRTEEAFDDNSEQAEVKATEEIDERSEIKVREVSCRRVVIASPNAQRTNRNEAGRKKIT